MNSLNLNLVIFTSTKGHFGKSDICEISLKDLYNKIPLEFFTNKYVHIKVSDTNEGTVRGAEMVKFYESYGFKVITTRANWEHFQESHQIQYLNDIKKMYLNEIDSNTKFTLHAEDDWLFQSNSGLQLTDYIEKMQHYLFKNKDCVAVRFPRFHNEVTRIGGLRQKHGMDVDIEQDKMDKSFFIHNDNLSLNPTIFRTSDIRTAARLAELNPNINHVEMGFSKCVSILSRGKYPYAIIDPNEINVLHIGTKTGEEDKPNIQIISN